MLTTINIPYVNNLTPKIKREMYKVNNSFSDSLIQFFFYFLSDGPIKRKLISSMISNIKQIQNITRIHP